MKDVKYNFDAEKFYNQNYQRDEYRGIILDENDYVVERCVKMFATREEAINDAIRVAENKYNRPNDFNTSLRKVWVCKKNYFYKMVFLIIIVAILIWVLACFLLGDANVFILLIYIFLLPFILIFTQRKQIVNTGSYIFDNGLYLVFLRNNMMSSAMVLDYFGLKGAALATSIKGHLDNEYFLRNVKSIGDIERLCDDNPLIWQFCNIINVEKINENKYKIEAEYIDKKNNKRKSIKFTLRNCYENFDELVKCFDNKNILNGGI